MFKKNIFTALMILSCNNIHGILDNKESLAIVNKQEENQTLPSLYLHAKRTLIGLGSSVALYGIAACIIKDKSKFEKCMIFNAIGNLTFLGTGACIMTDVMIFINERDKTIMNFNEKQQKEAIDFGQRKMDSELHKLELQKELAQTSHSK